MLHRALPTDYAQVTTIRTGGILHPPGPKRKRRRIHIFGHLG